MSPEFKPTDFDPAAVTAALIDTWIFPTNEEPNKTGLLHFTDTGRAIQFVFDPQKPERRIPMRLWYSVESPTELRFRSKPDQQGWLRGYRLDASTMTLLAEERSWICTRPSLDDIPGWFHEALASELDRQ